MSKATRIDPDSTWAEWLWSFLPDRCEMLDCERRGVRGNENVVEIVAGHRALVCDYCHAAMRNRTAMRGADASSID